MRNIRSFMLLLVLLVALVVITAGAGLSRRSAAGEEPRAPAPVHVVVRGETLWALARNYAPGEDPRRFVDALQRINGLSGAFIQAGDRLKIPSM